MNRKTLIRPGRYRLDKGKAYSMVARCLVTEDQRNDQAHPTLQWNRMAFLLMFLVISVGCSDPSNIGSTGDAPMSFSLTSSAFKEGTAIPTQYTGDGADQSPPLRWSELPPGTQSLALICDDPDAPRGTWVHWVLFNLPPDTKELAEAIPTTPTLPNGAEQGKNDFGNIGYGGPAPPKGKAHRYFFKLYALSASLELASGSTKSDLETAMKGRILADGQLMGTYQR